MCVCVCGNKSRFEKHAHPPRDTDNHFAISLRMQLRLDPTPAPDLWPRKLKLFDPSSDPEEEALQRESDGFLLDKLSMPAK